MGQPKGCKPWNKGKTGIYTKETKLKMKLNHVNVAGEKNPAWKGGKIAKWGYVYIYSPNHPYKSINNYVAEHRLIMEKELGRYLKPEEIVHHINKDVTDNRINNLELFTSNYKHLMYHKELLENNANTK